MRITGTVEYLAVAVTLTLVTGLPDPDKSDHGRQHGCACPTTGGHTPRLDAALDRNLGSRPHGTHTGFRR